MAPSGKESEQAETQRGVFATTHWSVVLAAGQAESPQAAEALEKLCRTYWFPLYAYIRRRGYEVADAQDLVQGFFFHILSRGFLQRARPDKGRFRSFILGSLKFFLADELAKLQAQKRGGGRTMVFLDAHSAEERYRLESVEQMDAEKLFERRWAISLLERVLERLEGEFTAAGKGAAFERLRDFLLGDRGSVTYHDTAAALGMTEGAIKVAVHRMRQRYRELFNEEIAQTVADPAEIEQEMRHVFASLCM
ncbi:MAG TPA: sigma-70 family RNA polymerase sigma factor [Candidatus Paceibacterota bacterium]|nr:sigma-70 family RNA polymerase sigma factor [Candidatus Paceibacterota bacterium]